MPLKKEEVLLGCILLLLLPQREAMFLFTLPCVKQDFYHVMPDERSHFHPQPETHTSLFPTDLGSVRALQPTFSSSFLKANLCSFIQGECKGVGVCAGYHSVVPARRRAPPLPASTPPEQRKLNHPSVHDRLLT